MSNVILKFNSEDFVFGSFTYLYGERKVSAAVDISIDILFVEKLRGVEY